MQRLTRFERHEIAWWTDPALADAGVVIAFSERSGGNSSRPYGSLNLAAHVGDDPDDVDRSRSRLLAAVGLDSFRDRLTMADQVHGHAVAMIEGEGSHSESGATPGCGAWALASRRDFRPPVTATDALVTRESGVPLLLCFADCVPVILVALGTGSMRGPAVAVVHAGWRGALAGIAGQAVRRLESVAACETSQVRAYVGPHIGACHYEVGDDILSQFVNTFGTVARAESGGLDLGAVVSASLTDAGVDPCSIASLGTCTAEATDRFFSHRAEGGLTGRHGALACILPPLGSPSSRS